MSEKPHKKLAVWEEIMRLMENVYHLTSKFPKGAIDSLTTQMRRASISIASNVAEECARKGSQEKIQFFTIARGSLSELDAQLEIALRLNYIEGEAFPKTDEQLNRLILTLGHLTLTLSAKWRGEKEEVREKFAKVSHFFREFFVGGWVYFSSEKNNANYPLSRFESFPFFSIAAFLFAQICFSLRVSPAAYYFTALPLSR